ncbi:MAG TPA: hypothetical protein VFE60_26090, partial [Roseiarcus sp.]|nr:hypothetical protein [Roseiarcus sp.]
MIAVSRSFTPSDVSIVTVEAALSEEFGQNPTLPNWSPSFPPAANEAAAAKPILDRLLIAMAGVGHSVAALSLYLGLKDSEVRECVAALNLPAAAEKPLRRPVSANPWSVEEVRRLIALWLDNVSVMSIAGALGRTPASIQGKRRWLGLGVRVRKDLADRTAAQCRATALPWKPTLNIKPILSRLWAPRIGKGAAAVARPEPVSEVTWELGRDTQKDDRFSTLGFAGLSAAAIAKRMLMEFGVYLTEGAVNSRMTRLQIARDRFDIIDVFDEEAVQ